MKYHIQKTFGQLYDDKILTNVHFSDQASKSHILVSLYFWSPVRGDLKVRKRFSCIEMEWKVDLRAQNFSSLSFVLLLRTATPLQRQSYTFNGDEVFDTELRIEKGVSGGSNVCETQLSI